MAQYVTTEPFTMSLEPNSTIEPTVDPQEEWFKHAVGAIRTSFLPVVVVGTITNILNLIVFTRPEMRSLSTTVYLLALAIADLGVMYFELFRIWFEWMDHIVDPAVYFSDAYCKVSNYLNMTFRDFSNWLIACITIERVVILVSPLKARIFCTVRRARIISGAVAFIIFTAHIHYLVFSSVTQEVGWTCWENPDIPLSVGVTAWVEFVVGYSVVTIVFVLNIILAVLFCRGYANRAKLTNDERLEQTRRLTSTMLALGIMFFVCELPRVVVAVLFKYQEKTYSLRLAMNATFLVSGINHACNFFLYVLSGRKFRNVLVRVLHCQCGRRRIVGGANSSTINLRASSSSQISLQYNMQTEGL